MKPLTPKDIIAEEGTHLGDDGGYRIYLKDGFKDSYTDLIAFHEPTKEMAYKMLIEAISNGRIIKDC